MSTEKPIELLNHYIAHLILICLLIIIELKTKKGKEDPARHILNRQTLVPNVTLFPKSGQDQVPAF